MHDCPLCDTYIHDQLEFPTEPEHLEFREEIVRIVPNVKWTIKQIIKEHEDIVDMFRGFSLKDIWNICEGFPNSNILMTDCMAMIQQETGMRIRAAKHWFVQRSTSILSTIYDVHQEHSLKDSFGRWESNLPFANAVPAEEAAAQPLPQDTSAKRQASFFNFLC